MTELSKTLRNYTGARVSLGRTGSSLPVKEMLDLQLAHARARDAVHAPLDAFLLRRELESSHCVQDWQLEVQLLKSKASDRMTYLRRPDLGRALNSDSEAKLKAVHSDLVLVLADGLSSRAVLDFGPKVIDAILDRLERLQWAVGPLCIVEQGRVAVGDAIGAELKAKFAVVLIGERPGLSSPNSLGAYITWNPKSGRTDAERNCVSNIHSEGLTADEAARRICFYLSEGRTRQLTGVDLKYAPGQLLK